MFSNTRISINVPTKYEEYTKLYSPKPQNSNLRFPLHHLSKLSNFRVQRGRVHLTVHEGRGGGRKKRQATRLECFERRGATRRGNAFCRVDAHEEDRAREREREGWRGGSCKAGGPVSPLGEPWYITHDVHVLFREECAPRRWSQTFAVSTMGKLRFTRLTCLVKR